MKNKFCFTYLESLIRNGKLDNQYFLDFYIKEMENIHKGTISYMDYMPAILKAATSSNKEDLVKNANRVADVLAIYGRSIFQQALSDIEKRITPESESEALLQKLSLIRDQIKKFDARIKNNNLSFML